MANWSSLDRELDAWGKAGNPATLWWRDDDAVAPTAAVRQLLDVTVRATERPVSLALAVVPALADDGIGELLRTSSHVVALQHGYAHANRACPGAKKSEYPAGWDVAAAIVELRTGLQRMRQLFAEQVQPVLVPPWNRINAALVDRLAETGLLGLSTYGPRMPLRDNPGTTVINTHVDIMNWRSRRFLGTEACLDLAIGHLSARRKGEADPREPTGLLTHHMVHDADAWSFLSTFVQRTTSHPAARWQDARELFGCGSNRPA